MGGLSFLVSSGTFHQIFWIKKYKGNCVFGTGVAEHLHLLRSCWNTFTNRDLEDGILMPSQPSPLLGGPWRKDIGMQGGGSFQVGFLRDRMGKADGERRWEVSKASSMAADTCFFQNRLNLSPCCHLSAHSGRSEPPAGWRARGSRAAPSSCTRASSSPWKGVVFSALPRDLLGQVEVWALLSDRLSTSRQEWARPYSPTEPGVRDREVQGGFAWFLFRKGDFKYSFKKHDNVFRFLNIN